MLNFNVGPYTNY